MQILIKNDLDTYTYIDSWGDILSECSYNLYELLDKSVGNPISLFGEDINLGKVKNQNLIEFLKIKKYKGNISDFQCYDFVAFVDGVQSFDDYKQKILLNYNIEKQIKTGDTICICDTTTEENNFLLSEGLFIKKPYFHFAIYLKDGFYISKFGKGDIYITTLNEMKKIYNYDNIYILRK